MERGRGEGGEEVERRGGLKEERETEGDRERERMRRLTPGSYG